MGESFIKGRNVIVDFVPVLGVLFLAGCSRFRAFANSPYPIVYSQCCESGLCVLSITQDARCATPASVHA